MNQQQQEGVYRVVFDMVFDSLELVFEVVVDLFE